MTEVQRSLHQRLGRRPWRWHADATAQDREQQRLWQEEMAAAGDCRFGAGVFVSPEATVACQRLRLGDRTVIGSEAQLGMDVELGADCTVNAGATVRGKVRAGAGVRIASHAQVVGFNHGVDDPSRPMWQQPATSRGITLGEDVWIGANAVVLDGVNVGAHAVVGAGAVVTRDVPPWAIVGGSPARVIRFRPTPEGVETPPQATPQAPAPGDLPAVWQSLLATMRAEMPDVLARVMEGGTPRDHPGAAPSWRPWCDAVELSVRFGCDVPGHAREALVDRLRAAQDPVTGLVSGPFAEGRLQESPAMAERLLCLHTAYLTMATGYALRLLGSRLPHPVAVAENLSTADLFETLEEVFAEHNAWGAGAWVDHFGSALALGAREGVGSRDVADLFGWLATRCDPATGMWGPWRTEDRWRLPVNGFYRLTRGTYAQWGLPLPHPERVVDTVLAHASDPGCFGPGRATACDVLDLVHPLWLAGRQGGHRAAEARNLAAHWLRDTAARWQSGAGFSFETRGGCPAGLKGTEMWASIAWICADLLGLAGPQDAPPRGVHRPEPLVSGRRSLPESRWRPKGQG